MSDSGGANYSLPLWVPDGPLGMQPALTIGYQGGGGNGHLGSGMSLTGLSEIAPCRKTFASEGLADGVDFDAQDSYCLDGNKLVEITDPDYTGPSTDLIYHTEHETFARIVAQFDANHVQPIRFVVHHRDGSKRTYPARYASQFIGLSETQFELDPDPRRRVAFAYPIQRHEDRNGNHIDYSYETNDATGYGEVAYRIKSIGYSYAGGLIPRRMINLVYEDRPDDLVRYHRGVKLVTRTRIKTIQMFAPNPTATGLVWSYNLGYVTSKDTNDSLLSSVQLCTVNGSCSHVRHFSWSKAYDGPSENVEMDNPVEFTAASLSMSEDYWAAYYAPGATHNWVPQTDVRIMVFDADNDGDDDLLYRTAPTIVEANVTGSLFLPQVSYQCFMGTIRKRLSAGGLLGPAEDSGLEEGPGIEPSGCPGTTELYPMTNQAGVNLGKSRVADFDGDGALELRLAMTSIWNPSHPVDLQNGTVSAGLWKYTYETLAYSDGWNPPGPEPADEGVVMHGPVGRAKWVEEEGWTTRQMLLDPPFQQVLADVDGDRRIEAIDAVHGNINMMDYQNVDWNEPFAVHDNDFTYTVTPSSTATPTSLQQRWVCGNGRARILDVEGDGRDDVLVTNETVDPGRYWRLSLSDDGAVENMNTSQLWAGDCGPALHDNPDLVTGDWNGDGLADVMYPPGSYYNNGNPLVRMNLGNGFGPFETMLVTSTNPDVSAADMRQDAPIGRDGNPVPWDRGTRTVDLNNDGRTDVVAFRQDNAHCIDLPKALFAGGAPYSFDCTTRVFAFLSNGDHFVGQYLTLFGNFDPEHPTGASIANGFTNAQIGDVTGDGAIDLVTVMAGKLKVTELAWRVTPDRLVKVTDDSTPFALESFEYTRQWWGDAGQPYQPYPEACEYPVKCSVRGFPVVRTHRVFAGTDAHGDPMYRTFLHTFQRPRSDLRGRGGLGMAEHRIWDRELGSETILTFDNMEPLDLDASTPGGEFYRSAHHPGTIITIVPTELLPTPAELASTDLAPGLSGSTTVRVSKTVRTRLPRSSDNGRILTLLPRSTEHYVADFTFTLDKSGVVPTYGEPVLTGEMIEETTTVTSDQLGNPTSVVTTTSSGMVRHTHTTYHNDLTNWHLGQPTRIALESHDANDGASPVRIVRTAYDTLGRPITIDVLGLEAGTCPDEQDCPALEAPATHQSMIYDTRGNVIATSKTAFDDPTPRTAMFQYDTEGVYRARTTDALGFSDVRLIHPAVGVAVLTEDAIGIQGTSTYDAFGRVVTTSHPATPTTTRVYAPYAAGDRRGTSVNVVGTDDRKSYSRVDEVGRVVWSATMGFDDLWVSTHREYDRFGNVVRAGRPTNSQTISLPALWSYDRLGRAVSHQGHDWTLTTFEHPAYDPINVIGGKLTTVETDPEGHETFITRDLAGRVIRSGHRVGGADYGTLQRSFGPFDQLERVTDQSGKVTHHHYDRFGRRTGLDDPDTGHSSFAYDGFGALVSSTNGAGVTKTTKYDVLGRVVESTGPDGTSTRQYGTTGPGKRRLVQAVSADGVISAVTYDVLGRVSRLSQTVNGITDRIDQAYDNQGRLALRFYPEAPGYPRFATFAQWNGAGYLTSIDDVSSCNIPLGSTTLPGSCDHPPIWTVQARNLDGALTAAKFGNKLVEQRGYDSATGRLEQLQLLDGSTTLDSFTYQYQDDGLLERRTHGDRVETFTHDDLHRVTNWTIEGEDRGPAVAQVDYSYDPLGNLLDVKRNAAVVWTGDYSSGRPHALVESTAGSPATTTRLDYDSAGREIKSGTRETSWTQDDMPSEITQGASIRRFLYGTSNERVVSESAEETITYLGKLYERHLDASLATRHVFFVHGDTGIVAQMTYADNDPKLRFVVNDSLNSAVIVHDESGIVEPTDFAPFGQRVDAHGNVIADPDKTTSFGFTNHEEDPGGLINMNGRIYDPAQYRFLSPDPIIGRPLFGQNHNPYSYVMNSPLHYTDPSGFDPPEGDGTNPPGNSNDGDDYLGNGDVDDDEDLDKGCTDDCGHGFGTELPNNAPAEARGADEMYQRPSDLGAFGFTASGRAYSSASWQHDDLTIEDWTQLGREPEGEAAGNAPIDNGLAVAASHRSDPHPAAFRGPDYIELSASFGPFGITVIRDRYGQHYVGGTGDLFDTFVQMLAKRGLVSKWGAGASLYGGWLLQPGDPFATPTPKELESFLTGIGFAIEGGYFFGGGGEFAAGDSAKSALVMGARTPGASIGPSLATRANERAIDAAWDSWGNSATLGVPD